jgi:hypothetical protein
MREGWAVKRQRLEFATLATHIAPVQPLQLEHDGQHLRETGTQVLGWVQTQARHFDQYGLHPR